MSVNKMKKDCKRLKYLKFYAIKMLFYKLLLIVKKPGPKDQACP